MYKVKVSVPATSINLGPGLHVLGLALSLQTTVDFQIRSDDELRISVSGEAKDHIPANFDNPALRAAMRVFQRFERAPVGLHMSISNAIPVNVGFGLRTALIVGGLVAANNLIDAGLPRDELMQMALQFGLAQPRVVTTILGGLSICGDPDTKDLFYHNFEVMPLRVVAVLPKLANFHEITRTLPNQIDLNNAIFNIGRMPLLTEALCYGAYELLPRAFEDRIYIEEAVKHIPGYADVKKAALDHGALAVTLSGSGPVVLAFCQDYQDAIAEAMHKAFAKHQIESQTWTLGVDRQGIVVSVFE